MIFMFGTKTAIANALGIRPQAVYQWKKGVPPLRALQLEKIIEKDGRISVASDSPTQ